MVPDATKASPSPRGGIFTYPDELECYQSITLLLESFNDFANHSAMYAIGLDHDK
jgi:hypothetical protein